MPSVPPSSVTPSSGIPARGDAGRLPNLRGGRTYARRVTSESNTSPAGAAPKPTTLADALTNEHHAIDAGIEAFMERSGDVEGDVSEWAEPLLEAMRALRRHIYLEEEIVFPRIRRGPLMMPVMVMLREHGEIWREMDALDAALVAPAQSGPRAEELVVGCRRMLALLEQHNMKEEPVIYPHLDSDMDWAAQAQLREFLAEGTLPEGWVCEKAGQPTR